VKTTVDNVDKSVDKIKYVTVFKNAEQKIFDWDIL
jgi:hypothetical protein